jgi:hypothetical protein
MVGLLMNKILIFVLLFIIGCSQEKRNCQLPSEFDNWRELVTNYDNDVKGLHYAFLDPKSGIPRMLSLSASAYALEHNLNICNDKQAISIGDTILKWQGSHDRIDGAFPSAFIFDEEWKADIEYDSVDNLLMIGSLIKLYQNTGNKKYLNGAIRTGNWIRDIMADGVSFGLWLENHCIMRMVTKEGNFDNRIPIGRTLGQLDVLNELTDITGDRSYSFLADKCYLFLIDGQHENGGWYSWYNPGYPPTDGVFETWGIDGSVHADDSLRAALGILKVNKNAAKRTFDWINSESGIYGYIDLETGDPLFVEGDEPYYDIVSSALLRDLAVTLGNELVAISTNNFVQETQDKNGGWYWGWTDVGPLENTEQSSITGFISE